mgnify:CR=1 FL=1
MKRKRKTKEEKELIQKMKDARSDGFRKLSIRQRIQDYEESMEIGEFIFVKGRKAKYLYFNQDVEDAIVEYNKLEDNNSSRKNHLYNTQIHAAFDKLAENIINTFKFSYFDYGFEDVKHEVVAFLVMNMHKYDNSKGYKAFSYFSVVAKNYLILHNNNNYKRYKTHHRIDVKPEMHQKLSYDDRDKNYYKEFLDELIVTLENNVPTLFKRKRDIDIAFSIIELMRERETIENFNKKSLYLLIREMTGSTTNHITRVMNILKKEYKKAFHDYNVIGSITDQKKFF